MATHFLHPEANIWAKFHENRSKTEGVVHDARFSPHFCHNMLLPWQHTFCHCQTKCVLHIYTPRQTSVPNFMRICENWGSTCSSRRKIFPPFCHMPLPWQHSATVKKMCLAYLHPKANTCAKFHENWWKTEEVVRDARFPPIFAIICRCHNMPLPWQHTFCHCQQNVSCTSTPQGKHLCQITWELVKNWGSSSRRKIFPPFLP